MEVLSYHATCSKTEVDKFKAANIPLVCELGIDKLSFDDFSLDVDAMITAALRMFMELGMVQKFKIDYETLCRWLLTVRKNYRNVLYHNWRHAFNVCQCMFSMLSTAGFQETLSELEILALIVGCVCHDLDHRGTNNAFQAKTGSALSLLYGTSATMEHHHFNHAVMILQSEVAELVTSRFWSELDEVIESIPTGERVVIGADFNGHVGEGNTGDEEVMGKFGVKERNLEGQMVVDFAKRMVMAVVNTYFQKREEHRVTYKSGGRSTQVDYILCRRGNLKEISDCKVVVGESVARQHRMVVCRMTLMVCNEKRSKIEKKTKRWKLKKEERCEEFRQKLRQALGGQVLLPDDWETTAEVIRETGRKVLGVSSGRRKEDKETWWWNEEVQDSIQRKRLAKKKWDMDRTEENRQEYKELQCRVKREVSKAKQKAYDELYTRLDTREGQKDLYRLARQRDRDGKDVQQVRVIKDRDGRVLTSEESVQRRWKEYFEELMNEKSRRGELCGTESR
ncbi:hypothetical protein QTP86_008606 [Hemibagrus guttatus]|nr:hypothetical protein QTP86_008606 [Hemibagrus guttatus]